MIKINQLILLILLGTAFSICHAAERPNIIFLLSDDQAWTDYGFMGHPDIQTPNLDKLASEGLLFRRGYHQGIYCRALSHPFLTSP